MPPLDSIDDALRFVAARIEANDGDDPPVARCAAWLEREKAASRSRTSSMRRASAAPARAPFPRRRRPLAAPFRERARLRSVFDALEANPGAGWTDAALAAGYFDQSHLIRDFRRFVGCTPAQFVASHPGLATALVEA
jgi:AraC-like DNA-binding protein